MATSINKELSGETLAKAIKELNEVPEERDGAIEEFRSNIKESAAEEKNIEDFSLLRLDDNAFLLRFLRAKKFRQDKAMEQYFNYCKYRTRFPEVFEDLSLERVKYVFEKNIIGLYDHPLKNGCRLIFFFPQRDVLSDDFNFNHVIGALFLLLEKMLEDPETQVHGVIGVENWEGIGFAQMVKIQFLVRNETKKLMELFQTAFPVRMKGMWTVNEPWFMDIIFMFIKPFLTEKMKDRIRFLGTDYSCLHELTDPDLLPEEFGGPQLPFSCDYTIKFLEGKTEENKD